MCIQIRSFYYFNCYITSKFILCFIFLSIISIVAILDKKLHYCMNIDFLLFKYIYFNSHILYVDIIS